MRKICIYGKGGIGKSTTAANVAAAMAESGLKTAVVGCDPKADTTRCLVGRRIPTVLQQLGSSTENNEIAVTGYRGILCIESGGPEPGTGCAGRGIASALREIKERDLLADRDVVLYDVLGDVVCGGFSMPLREGVADDVYLVTTSDFMAIYAANNICRGIAKYAQENEVRLAGIIYNEEAAAAIQNEWAFCGGDRDTGDRLCADERTDRAGRDREKNSGRDGAGLRGGPGIPCDR